MDAAKILIVDDDPLALRALERALRREDWRIYKAINPAVALHTLQELNGEVDVVITDNRMPVIRGLEFLGTLRKEYPSVERVMITGDEDVSTLQAAVNSGRVAHFFVKPYDVDQLRQAIAGLVGGRDTIIPEG